MRPLALPSLNPLIAVVVAPITFVFLIGAACYYGVGSRRAPEITRQGFLSLRPGMSERRVEAAIGPPLYKKKRFRPVKKGEEDQAVIRNSSTWIYGASGFCDGGLEISLSIKEGRLEGAYIASHDFLVYRCDDEKCPDVWNPRVLRRLR